MTEDMSEPIEWNRLDAAAYRLSMKRSVRRLAWLLSVVGVIVIACGIKAPLLPLVVIGAVFLIAGVWNLRRTSVTGLVVDGIAVTLAGVFSALAWQWVERGDTHMAKAMFGGLLQILWGIKRIRLWTTARNAYDDPPAIALLEAIVAELSKRKSRDETVVEFTTGRFPRWHRNRLGLYTEGVVGLLEGGVVRLDKRSDTWIEARGTDVRAETIKVSVRMSDLELTATMDAKHLERFERWKLAMTATRSIAA
jgi:hypothetical protein